MTSFKNLPKEHSERVFEAKKQEEKSVSAPKKNRSFFGWKTKGFFFLVVLFLVAAGVQYIISGISSWFDQYRIVSHQILEVKISSPFTIEPRMVSPVVTPEASASAMPKPEEQSSVKGIKLASVKAQEPSLIDQLASYIHLAESTRGKATTGLAVTCRGKGMSNEYGYRALEGFCFDNEAQAIDTVKDWLYRSLQVRGVPETLCRYNTGHAVEDCEYANTFLELLADGKI